MKSTVINGSSQQFGDLRIDHEAHEVSLNGHPIHLTLSEFVLLTTLAESPRRAFSNEYLTQILTRSDWLNTNHALQVTVSRLRRKLGESGRQPKRIVTVHGYGYRFEPDKGPDLAAAMAATAQPAPPDPSMLCAYAVVAVDRRILWVSDGFTQLLDWPPSDLQDTDLYELIHPDDSIHAMAAREYLDEGSPAAAAVHLINAAGEYRLVEALARPLLDPQGKIVCFLNEFRPATAVRIAECATPSPIHMDQPESLDQRDTPSTARGGT